MQTLKKSRYWFKTRASTSLSLGTALKLDSCTISSGSWELILSVARVTRLPAWKGLEKASLTRAGSSQCKSVDFSGPGLSLWLLGASGSIRSPGMLVSSCSRCTAWWAQSTPASRHLGAVQDARGMCVDVMSTQQVCRRLSGPVCGGPPFCIKML